MSLKVSSEFAKLITVYGEEKITEVMRGWEKRCDYQRLRYHKKVAKALAKKTPNKKGGKK